MQLPLYLCLALSLGVVSPGPAPSSSQEVLEPALRVPHGSFSEYLWQVKLDGEHLAVTSGGAFGGDFELFRIEEWGLVAELDRPQYVSEGLSSFDFDEGRILLTDYFYPRGGVFRARGGRLWADAAFRNRRRVNARMEGDLLVQWRTEYWTDARGGVGVYRRQGNRWRLEGGLRAPRLPYLGAGWTEDVAIGKSRVAFVGGSRERLGPVVHVYAEEGGSWQKEAELPPCGEPVSPYYRIWGVFLEENRLLFNGGCTGTPGGIHEYVFEEGRWQGSYLGDSEVGLWALDLDGDVLVRGRSWADPARPGGQGSSYELLVRQEGSFEPWLVLGHLEGHSLRAGELEGDRLALVETRITEPTERNLLLYRLPPRPAFD